MLHAPQERDDVPHRRMGESHRIVERDGEIGRKAAGDGRKWECVLSACPGSTMRCINHPHPLESQEAEVGLVDMEFPAEVRPHSAQLTDERVGQRRPSGIRLARPRSVSEW